MGLGELHETRSYSTSDLLNTIMSEQNGDEKNSILDDNSSGIQSEPKHINKDLSLLKRSAPGQPSGYYSHRFYYSLPHHYKLALVQSSKDKAKLSGFPGEFPKKLEIMLKWFREFTDEQKNQMLTSLLADCEQPQNHHLSILLQDKLHIYCPVNCQDFLLWLPPMLTYKILSYLDPVSLAKCSQVCRYWKTLANSGFLWQKLCLRPPWKLSPGGHSKQLSVSLERDGGISWKKIFAERYRLHRNWLKGQCHVRTFEGHSQGISCVQFDDTRIVSGSHDKTIKVWNMRTNSPWSVMTLVGHSGTVRCLHLLGSRLVSGSTDRTLKVWDLSVQDQWSSIACKVTMIGHSDTVRCVQMDMEKVVSGSYDHTLKIWNIKTGECLQTLRGHSDHVLCLQFNDKNLVSGSADKTIKVWDLNEGKCVATLCGHQDAVTCISFDDQRIISGSLDRSIKLWSIVSGECLSTLDWKTSEGHTGVIRCLQANAWRMVSAADDRTLKVWQLQTHTGQRLLTLRNHSDGVTCLQFNDFIIVSGSYDRTVKLWDFSVC